MSVLAPLNCELQQLADEHRQWLSEFDPQYLVNWDRLFNADDEAAMTEAAVRRLLQVHGVTVEPNEDLTGTGQSVDFRCAREASIFFVEVTRISKAKATATTGIDEEPGFSAYGPMNDAIFEACRKKARQCSSADGPVLLAIGTWHAIAAMATFRKFELGMLLTGETKLSWNVDVSTGHQIGDSYQTTELFSAAFLRPDPTQEVDFARNSIAGLLFVANAIREKKTLGIIHPNPAREFDVSLLPDIEFGRVEMDRATRRLHVRWPQGEED